MDWKELSLVARYDDSIRHPLFTFQEGDWRNFISHELKVRQELRGKNRATDKLEADLKQANNERKRLEFTLAQVRRELEEEMLERKRVQTELDQLARQMQIIKELVGSKGNQSYNLLSEEERQKLAFLNNSNPYGWGSPSMMDTGLLDESLSLLSESEYDKTGDDILQSRVVRRSKRRSRPSEPRSPYRVPSEATLKNYSVEPTAPPESEEKTPPKRRRLLGGDTETSIETDDSSTRPPPQTDVKPRRSSRNKMKRSLSAGARIDDEDVDTDSFHDIDTGRRVPLSSIPPKSILKNGGFESPTSPPESPTIKRWASASKLQRQHNLFSKNVMRPESCTPCGKKIRFGHRAFKCKDCKVASHVECKARLSQLCIPTDATPCKGTQGNRIIDFAPPDPPFVPAIILQCVNEVESRGFNEEGIYRKSGSEREVKELKDRFMKGKDPKLDSVSDIHVISGCLKDFIRNLKEPLIPTSLWTSFVNAAHLTGEHQRSRGVREAIKQLPSVNRDCIAFLILHLQRPNTRMGIDNLAKVFGPTMVGYSVKAPEPAQMISETHPQQDVMTSLLEHSTEFWTNILRNNYSDAGSCDYDYAQTPETARRGGSDSDASVPKSSAKVRQFFGESPRFEESQQHNRTYFPSPMLK
ncbi:rac GTPase-activating protein 1-like isoform X2 [Watersipora subatra]|uniref:rac GTPase-activating protein 1-like isoform X2 n=1 Tax=Watersipora subatra TaxID=2589382 RepID=UPI00355BBF7E